MRRKWCLLTVLLLCLALLVGCSQRGNTDLKATRPDPVNPGHTQTEPTDTEPMPTEPEPTDSEATEDTEPSEPIGLHAYSMLKEELWEYNCVAGIAYVGYVGYDSTIDDVMDCLQNSEIAQEYPFLLGGSIALSEEYPGAEVYAIVPASEYGVTVYPYVFTDSEDYEDMFEVLTDEPIYEGEPGEVVILRCNISDIIPNTEVSVSGNLEAFTFHPMLSGMDGHVVEEAGILDFSLYEEDPVSDGYELLYQYDEIQSYLDMGMTLLWTGDEQLIDGQNCLLYALGTDQEDQFVREQLYAVGGDDVYWYDPLDDSWNILGAG